MEQDKEKEIPPVPYKRFKEIIRKNKELELENVRLRAQIEALEKVILQLKQGLPNP